MSLNRFEAKKNVELALRAFAKLRSEALLPKSDFEGLRLVIGGKLNDRHACLTFR